jgi:prepilin-type processing-associated H-X9-DG protein
MDTNTLDQEWDRVRAEGWPNRIVSSRFVQPIAQWLPCIRWLLLLVPQPCWPVTQKLPGAINVAFYDGHAELMKLDRLWQLYCLQPIAQDSSECLL